MLNSHFLNQLRFHFDSPIQVDVATKHTSIDHSASFTMTTPSPVLALLLLLLVALSTMFTETQAAGCGAPPNLATCYSAAVADVMPSDACCQGLKTYIATSGPACLCQAATSSQFAKSGAKTEYAIKLPQKCKLVFKAGTVCNGQVIPGGQ